MTGRDPHPWHVVATVHHADHAAKPMQETFGHTPITIGAATNNDIVLCGAQVSPLHAQVTVSKSRLLIEDRSREGTFRGGTRIQKAVLSENDEIVIGPFVLKLELVEGGDDHITAVLDHDWVEVVRGPSEILGRRLPIKPSGLSVGRVAGADFVVPVSTVSRRHAEFKASAGGGWCVRDLGSANGTLVNGSRVVNEVLLRDGDQVQMGEVLFTFHAARQRPARPGVSATGLPETEKVAVPDDLRPRSGARRAQPPTAARPLPEVEASAPVADEGVATLPLGGESLRLSTTRGGPRGAVVIVGAAGRLAGRNCGALSATLDRLGAAGERLIVVDLQYVNVIDQVGIDVLARAAAALRRASGELALCGMSSRVRERMALSGFETSFEGQLARDTEAALAALTASRR